MSYPTPADVEQHKDEIFKNMILYFHGKVNLVFVENSIRALFCDAMLEVDKHHKIEVVKTNAEISGLILKMGGSSPLGRGNLTAEKYKKIGNTLIEMCKAENIDVEGVNFILRGLKESFEQLVREGKWGINK